MPAERIFIDWNQPLLSAVVSRLVETRTTLVDLSGLIVVVSGRRAGRRLRELLAERTGGRHKPPRIVTIGELPELLYVPKRPFASELVQRLAWIEAIRALPRRQQQAVVRVLPDRNDLEDWFSLAEMLWRQHHELAAEGLDFDDVLQQGDTLKEFQEHARWRALSAIQGKYLQLLEERGLWDRQTARRTALRQDEVHTKSEIVLVGMSDLTRVQRDMLARLGDRVTAYIHAPARLADRFDRLGCLIPEAWAECTVTLADDQLFVADGPAEVAEAVVAAIDGLDGRFRPDEITVGVADQAVVPTIERTLKEWRIPARWGVGAAVARTPPVRLLQAVADYLEEDRTSAFAALVRHPDIGNWLTVRGVPPGWLLALDQFVQHHIPHRLADWVRQEDRGRWQRAFRAVQRLVRPLRGKPRRLSEWPSQILELLRTVYATARFDPDDPATQATISGLEQLQSALEEQEETPDELSPRVRAPAAIRLLLRELVEESVPPPAGAAEVEIMGWLELAMDDAPVTVVVGMNEGLIPQSMSADPFLPDGMRTALGVTNNARRYARDAHALLALLHSRQRVVLIAGRRDARGDPLAPSRLLLACDPEEVAARVRRFYRPPSTAQRLPQPIAPRDVSGLRIPRPRQCPPLRELPVTAFREYLASPYRFYLRHVEGLCAVDDTIEELSAAAFGSLAHQVLKRFGESELRDAIDPRPIEQFLFQALDEVAATEFGSLRIVAVDVQLEQLRARLRAFAEWQAAWTRSGWRIAFVEQPEGPGVPFDLPDGRRICLTGRIDRIDRYRNEDRWVVIDYKTGESSDTPDKSHRRDGEWVDLQLPLYRHLARSLGVRGEVQLGYVRLPRDTGDVRLDAADWSDDDLAAADETARRVAQRILDGCFWEVLEEEPSILQEYGPICQDGVYERECVV